MASTDYYKKQLKELHKKEGWGKTGYIPQKVLELLSNKNIKSVLDFGCGKGNVTRLLKENFPNVNVIGWDPAFSEEPLPTQVDLIMSIDVLEHIEPIKLDETLKDLQTRSKLHYHAIANHKATTNLPDGRNAHLIVETPCWWKDKLISQNYKIVYEEVYSRISKVPVVKYEVVLENEN
jgi:cyclopropane fatty-acyl-phospholipid synthase-like methyltransferase